MSELTRPWPKGLTRRTVPWLVLAGVVLLAFLYFADRPVSALLQDLPRDMVRVFRVITNWGESDWVLIPSATLMLTFWLIAMLLQRRVLKLAALQAASVAAYVLVGVGITGLVSTLLKRAIGRGRPEMFDSVGDLGFNSMNWDAFAFQSFPSGHATTAFAFAFVVGFVVPRLFWPALAMGVLVAISRIVLGMHYPTDVVGGFVLGATGAYLFRNLFADRGWAFRWRRGHAVPRHAAFRRAWQSLRRQRPA